MRFARGGNLDWLTDSGDSILLRIFAFATTPDVSKLSSAEEINDAANATLHRFVEANPSAEELGRKAAGVLVFPSVVKAGMLLAGNMAGAYSSFVEMLRAITTSSRPHSAFNSVFNLSVASRDNLIAQERPRSAIGT